VSGELENLSVKFKFSVE